MAANLELPANGLCCNRRKYYFRCRRSVCDGADLVLKGRHLLDILIMVPWALPGTVVAVNLIAAFSRRKHFQFQSSVDRYVLDIAVSLFHSPFATCLPLNIGVFNADGPVN